jgi:predicted nucleic acid-binding protein
MIIFDASPLIHITNLGKIEYIFKIFPEITIANAVYEEVIKKGKEEGYNDAILLEKYIEQKKIICKDVPFIDMTLSNYLHKGEYKSILLAESSGGLLIIDDRKARLIAKQKNISYNTTLGVLQILLKEHIINKNHYLENLKKYSDNGWISIQVYEEFKKEAEK